MKACEKCGVTVRGGFKKCPLCQNTLTTNGNARADAQDEENIFSVPYFTVILARVIKMQTGTYIIYSVLLILYGIIPAVFLFNGLCAVVYPSLICAACSLVSLATLLIFEGRNMTAELKRRLHL